MGYSFVGIDSDRGSVWDASKSAYGTTISAASFALGGSENGSLHYLVEPSEVRKLELKQGTKLQLASFGSTRLKGKGFFFAKLKRDGQGWLPSQHQHNTPN